MNRRYLLLGLALFGSCVFASDAPPDGTVLSVPFIRQDKNGCGPTSVAMVMGYWKKQVASTPAATAPELYKELGVTETNGASLSDMKRVFESRGYHAFTLRGKWADVEREVGRGRPVIATLRGGKPHELHFAVISGLDQKRVWLNDPARKKTVAMDRTKFENIWGRADHWMLLAVPKSTS